MIAPLIFGLALAALGTVVVWCVANLTDPADYPPLADPDPGDWFADLKAKALADLEAEQAWQDLMDTTDPAPLASVSWLPERRRLRSVPTQRGPGRWS